jgi:muconate cycloisomerase
LGNDYLAVIAIQPLIDECFLAWFFCTLVCGEVIGGPSFLLSRWPGSARRSTFCGVATHFLPLSAPERRRGAMAHENEHIERIELYQLFLPFQAWVRELMSQADGQLGMALKVENGWRGGDFVVAKVVTSSGHVGWGEAFLWLPETGLTPGMVVAAIKDGLAPYVVGESPFAVERMRQRMDAHVARNEVAKGLLDMACYDLMGHIADRPAHQFMGGRVVDEVPLAGLVPLMDLGAMTQLARQFCQDGMGTLRVKLGRGVSQDAEIISAIREEAGPERRLRTDYNQAYLPDQAVRAIKTIEPCGIDCAEQPVRADDFPAMAYVQARVDTPLMAHEGCFGLSDIHSLLALAGVRVIGINGERPGGVTAALRAIALAEQQGLGVVLHNQPLGIGAAMMIHVAAARHASLGHAMELLGHMLWESDLLQTPLSYERGVVRVPEGAGWGIAVDEAALEHYAVERPVMIERS